MWTGGVRCRGTRPQSIRETPTPSPHARQVFSAAALHPEDYIDCLRAAAAAEEARRAAQRAATGRIDFVRPAGAEARAPGPYTAPRPASGAGIDPGVLAAAQARAAALAAKAAASRGAAR